jgi:DNA repair protein SbcC/Rad50
MRPISLRLEGFTSFRQEATVDFTGFDLFAITGPTGAGKSSVIDAMIYALYGCTPRISNKSIRDLISQGSDRLKVIFEFSSGRDRYRISRATKWTGKQSLTDVRLEQKQGEEWTFLADKVSEAQLLVEKAIGLDFKSFTKSVVLPQGQFDEFLKGRIEDRRKILSDLLQLEIYGRMMQRANEITKDHRNKCDTLSDLLQRDYANATPENLTDLREQSKQLEPVKKSLESKLKRIQNAIPIALQLRQNRKDLTQAEADLTKLTPSHVTAEKRLARAQQAIDEGKQKIEILDTKIKGTTYNSALRDDLMTKLHHADRLSVVNTNVLKLNKSGKAKSDELAELESLNLKAQSAQELFSTERSLVEKELTTHRELFHAQLEKCGSVDTITSIIKVNQTRIKDQQRKIKLENELNTLVSDQKLRNEQIADFKERLIRAEGELAAAKARHELLRHQHAAADIKPTLERGKPCPVCEQEVKELPEVILHPSMEQAKKTVKTNEKKLSDLVKRTSTLEGELRQLEPQLTSKKEEIDITENRVREAAQQVQALLGTPLGDDSGDQLENLRKQVAGMQQKVNEITGQLDKCREKEATAKDEAAHLKRELSVTASELNSIRQQLTTFKNEAETLTKDLGNYSDLSVVNAELKAQNVAKEKFEQDRRARDTESEALSKAKDEFNECWQLRESLTTQEKALRGSRDKLTREIETTVESLLAEFPELNVKTAGPDRDAASQLQRESQQLDSQRLATQEEILRMQEQLRILEDKIAVASEMRTEIELHKSHAAVAYDLAMALRADQFIAFIQEEAYNRLAIDGSVHLETLSSNRYSFDFEKDEFVVVDHWHADESRPVATLSGGESFLASLALALALAEGLSGLSHGRSKFALESLFLDEGFGSLDSETLQTVLQSIETLGASERLVGIVSHIPELAEQLPGRISVYKAVGGSSIEVSS